MAEETSTRKSGGQITTTTKDPKNIAVLTFNAVGHVNGVRGALASSLLARGHNIYFLLEKAFQGQLEPLGFKEVIYEIEGQPEMKPGEQMAKQLLDNKILGKMTVEEKFENTMKYFCQLDTFEPFFTATNEALKKLMKEINIDLFIIDDAFIHPAIYHSSIPLVRCVTAAPFAHAMDPALPPPMTGLPSNYDKKQGDLFRQKLQEIFKNNAFERYVMDLGYPPYPSDWKMMEKTRVQLTVYSYPKELNHWKLESAYPNWFNIEVYNKPSTATTNFDLKDLVGQNFYKDDLQGKWSGKWIYMSLGSMGSIDLELMNRLMNTFEQRCPEHKFLVSKGPRHEEFTVPKNCFGERFLPQMQLLPLVDLVITHGGNNTLTETFVNGKPMVVMPLFCDQLDNAQRLVETSFGARIDPYDYDEDHLVATINKLLTDEQLKIKLKRASDRIKKTDAHSQFADIVEQILYKTSSQDAKNATSS